MYLFIQKSALILTVNVFLLNLKAVPYDCAKVAKSGYPKFPVPECSCGKRSVAWHPTREPRIVGGEEPPYGAVPWQVSLEYRGKHRCGGVLISKRIVLTAGHCYTENMIVVAGTHEHRYFNSIESTVNRQSLKVLDGFVHPDFRKLGPYSHDIALLILAEPGFKFNDNVKPACLTQETPTPGTWCEISGWGSQDARSPGKISPILKSAAVPILSLDTCRKEGVYGGRYQSILDSMICAGHLKGGIDACGGDSGSPLICQNHGRYEVVGLVSWGDGCAKKDRPGVYTNVPNFLTWIRETAINNNIRYEI
ncbi:transmembrane protease serine 3-like [Sitophilus oryzae]|uniref:Transmembrane protease serine 3-like n=1 Tax=Sitophilus oryzae TaxID=7048 RepID=A0A6J2Y152_SITOR|nr:transmembrane protease serine 3-like [Sitophilus oryzae]